MVRESEFDKTTMDVTELLHEYRELRQRLNDFPVAKPLANPLPIVEILKSPAHPIANMKPTSFPLYNGDRSNYLAWRRAVLSALKIDWNTFRCTNSRVFLMIYKPLEGKLRNRQTISLDLEE